MAVLVRSNAHGEPDQKGPDMALLLKIQRHQGSCGSQAADGPRTRDLELGKPTAMFRTWPANQTFLPRATSALPHRYRKSGPLTAGRRKAIRLQRRGSWVHGQVRARPCLRFPHSRRRIDPNRPRRLDARRIGSLRMGAPSAGRCPRPRRRPGSACTSAPCGGICPVGCWPTIGFRAAITASLKSRSRASGARTKGGRGTSGAPSRTPSRCPRRGSPIA